uniref:ANF_receptor domain-containing protein n=1 Tax=Heterorhabditis bacteriophora TaxID=37862 RepID=A0A1I7WJ13_HETBA
MKGASVVQDRQPDGKVRAFIGPYCNMATFWNVPIVGYMASSNAFADKSIYKTLSRVSLRTTNSLAEAVAALLKHYGWSRVGIATNTGSLAFERATAFEEVFHTRQITVIKKISPCFAKYQVMFDEVADAKNIGQSGLLGELSNSARSEL